MAATLLALAAATLVPLGLHMASAYAEAVDQTAVTASSTF